MIASVPFRGWFRPGLIFYFTLTVHNLHVSIASFLTYLLDQGDTMHASPSIGKKVKLVQTLTSQTTELTEETKTKRITLFRAARG